MRATRRYVQTFAPAQMMDDAFQLEHRFTFQHIEELACMYMAMTLFEAAGWHTLFDDAQIIRGK